MAVYLTGRTGSVCLQEDRGLRRAAVRITARRPLHALQPHKVVATEGATAIASLQFI